MTRTYSVDKHCAFKYYLNARIHRANGPAFIWQTGDWRWALHGGLHRYYGPANNTGGWWLYHSHRKN